MNIEDIINEVEKDEIKVVSFDIFDTLLCRPAIIPSDLFKIIDNRLKMKHSFPFYSARTNAEKVCRWQKKEEHDDVTLDEIYDVMKSTYVLSDEFISKLKEEEIKLETKYLKRRESVYRIYQKAKKLNKKVIIISDMYLPSKVLSNILNINNIQFDKLYVSCEYRKSKGSGKLYDDVLKDLLKDGTKPENVIHLGDNYNADIVKATGKGINAYHIPKAISRMKKIENLSTLISESCIKSDNSFIIGFLANKIFDDPFVNFQNNNTFGGNPVNIGEFFLGPFLFIFVKWILDNFKNDLKTLIFVLRDGYLPSIIFDLVDNIYKSNIEQNKIYLSRRMRYPYSIQTKDDFISSFYDLMITKNMSVEDFVKERMLINDKKKSEVIIDKIKNTLKKQPLKNRHVENFNDVFLAFNDVLNEFNNIHKATQSEIDITNKYIHDNIKEKDSFIFDVGYRGSVGSFLLKHANMNIPIIHLYDYSFANKCYAENVKTHSFITLSFKDRRTTLIAHLIELLISSEEGSVIGITEDGEYIRESNTMKENGKKNINIIQSGAIDFVKSFVNLFGSDIKDLFFDKIVFHDFIMNFLNNPMYLDSLIFKDMDFVDSNFLVGSDKEANLVFNDWIKSNAKANSINKEVNTQQQHIRSANAYLRFRSKLKRFIKFRLERLKLKSPVMGGFVYKCASRTLRILRRG